LRSIPKSFIYAKYKDEDLLNSVSQELMIRCQSEDADTKLRMFIYALEAHYHFNIPHEQLITEVMGVLNYVTTFKTPYFLTVLLKNLVLLENKKLPQMEKILTYIFRKFDLTAEEFHDLHRIVVFMKLKLPDNPSLSLILDKIKDLVYEQEWETTISHF